MKIHAAKNEGVGGRSVCRYTARPSRRVKVVPVAEFLELDLRLQCSDCLTVIAPLGTIRAQVAPNKWANVPVRPTPND